MIHQRIELYTERPHIHMMTYISEASPEMPYSRRPAVLVLPGGGYYMTSDREAEPIAKAFFAAGMNAFVLRYSVKDEAVGYQPLVDASIALAMIRRNADIWDIDPDKIVVCGFSAGGHLAASMGTLWHLPEVQERANCSGRENRPDGMILGYPVITAGAMAHKGSIHKLLNTEQPTDDQLDIFSLEKHVDDRTPPAFLWHTSDDDGVPVANSLLMGIALAEKKIPFEMHVYPQGPHGLGRANRETAPNPGMVNPHIAGWIDLVINWIYRLFDK